MRRADLISGIILVIFGLVMLFFLIPTQIEQAPEGFVSTRLVPNMMMVIIIFLAGLLIVTNLRAKADGAPDENASPVSKAELFIFFKLSVVFAIALAAYFWVSPLAAGLSIIVGSLLALGERRPLVIIAMPAFILTGVWLLFYKLLGTAII